MPTNVSDKQLRILKHILRFISDLLIVIGLTVVTQVGGVIYLIALFATMKLKYKRRWIKFGVFLGLYLISNLLIIPSLAPVFGRHKIKDTEVLEAHSWFYPLANRDYVNKNLLEVMNTIFAEFEKENSGMKIIYLDANFPFINDFPLFPHSSHNNGKHIDVSLLYELPNGELTNLKPSVSGYGVFEEPSEREYDRSAECDKKGYGMYSFPKYLTLGKVNDHIVFSNRGTKNLINKIIQLRKVKKIFLEPHLKTPLGFRSNKVRFTHCYAVRHDDHIHIQVH